MVVHVCLAVASSPLPVESVAVGSACSEVYAGRRGADVPMFVCYKLSNPQTGRLIAFPETVKVDASRTGFENANGGSLRVALAWRQEYLTKRGLMMKERLAILR